MHFKFGQLLFRVEGVPPILLSGCSQTQNVDRAGFNVNVGLIGHGKSLNTAVMVEGKRSASCSQMSPDNLPTHLREMPDIDIKGRGFARAVEYRKVSVISHVLPAEGTEYFTPSISNLTMFPVY